MPRTLSMLLMLSLGACSGGERHPDVILIVCDTLRADAIIDPAGKYDTPNIDALAQDGVLFTQVFAHAPMTLPSHTALFSSRPPGDTTVWNNGEKVPKDLPLLAEWMRNHGYHTRAVISLATLHVSPDKGLTRGFEDFDQHFWRMSSADRVSERAIPSFEKAPVDEPLFFFAHYQDPHEPYDSHGVEHREAEILLDDQSLAKVTTSDMSVWSQKVEIPPGRHEFLVRSRDPFFLRWFEVKEGGKDLEVTWTKGKRLEATREARLAIERKSDKKPCDVKLWINDVPDARERNERYAREVNYVDVNLGKFLDELHASGRYDDALVIFTSDHGEALGERNHWGHAQEVNDPQIHVPLIVKLPKDDSRRSALAARAGRLTQLMDLAPTILEFAGLPPLPGAQGKSLFGAYDLLLVTETHKPESKQNEIALRDEQFKMVYLPDDDSFQLFDIVRDPGEEHDVFATEKGSRPTWPTRLEELWKSGGEKKKRGGAPEGAPPDLRDLGYGGDDAAAEKKDEQEEGKKP